MKKYFDIIKSVELFKNIEDSDLEKLLNCMNTHIVQIPKDNFILFAGNKPSHIGIVLSGQLHIIKEDLDGNRTLVACLMPGDIFAEALCYAEVSESPVSVLANTDCHIMQFQYNLLLQTCPNSCSFHTKLVSNMLAIISKKNLILQNRIDVIALKSVRSKVLRYLESFVSTQGFNITIPLNREELSEYLCVDRSALSHELSRMKADGLIDYHKNHFKLKSQETHSANFL